MLKVIFGPRNCGILLLAGLALVFVGLLVRQMDHTVRLVYSAKEQSPRPNQPTSDNLMAQNEEASPHKSEYLPHGVAKIAFNRDGGVYLYDAQSKETKRIGDGYDPDISPKGDTIAFTADRDKSETDTTIKLFSLQTNAITEIKSLDTLNVRKPRWSHDGTKLAFTIILERRSHIGILEISTGEWYDVTKGLVFNDPAGVYSGSWSPDDASIVCHDLYRIYEISLSGNVASRIQLEPIIPVSEISSATRFQFSRDRKVLLFNGTWDPENSAIYLFDLTDHKLKRLTLKTVDASEPVWLPSDNEIMFSRGRDNASGTVFDLCVISLDSGKVETILKNAASGSYSTR